MPTAEEALAELAQAFRIIEREQSRRREDLAAREYGNRACLAAERSFSAWLRELAVEGPRNRSHEGWRRQDATTIPIYGGREFGHLSSTES